MKHSKWCNDCGQTKPVSEFFSNSARRDGLSVYCKECMKTRTREWYRENTQRHRKLTREWAKAHPTKMRESNAKYRKNNKARVKARLI